MRKRASSTCGMPSSKLMILMDAGFRDMAFSLGRNEKGSQLTADLGNLPQRHGDTEEGKTCYGPTRIKEEMDNLAIGKQNLPLICTDGRGSSPSRVVPRARSQEPVLLSAPNPSFQRGPHPSV